MAIKEQLIPIANIELSDVCVQPEVLREVFDLSKQGYDVALVDTGDEHRPDPIRQQFIDQTVKDLEESADGADRFREHPGIKEWARLTKRAIALHTLYHPDSRTVGEGIDVDIYGEPIMDGRSAIEILSSSRGEEKCFAIIRDYKAFIGQLIDNGSETHIGSRDFFRGVADARAVRTRANEAMEIAETHITNNPELDGDNLISASLACGAAGPVYNLVQGLEQRGRRFHKVILVDGDPMALATASSLAKTEGLDAKVELQLRNLLLEPLTSYIEPNSVDIVDLLGLFEYLPSDIGIALLQNVKDIVKPGGLIVFGNMLENRPQQKFFSDVVQWPNLEQRKIVTVLEMIQSAGFNLKKVKVRVPSEGVYGVFAIDVNGKSEEDLKPKDESVVGALGLTAVEEY